MGDHSSRAEGELINQAGVYLRSYLHVRFQGRFRRLIGSGSSYRH